MVCLRQTWLIFCEGDKNSLWRDQIDCFIGNLFLSVECIEGKFSILKSENLLTSSSRLVMLKYQSWLLRTLSTLAYSPLYLVGFLDESQVRRVELFGDYQENAYKPTALIVIDIDNPVLQLYEAKLELRVKFTGLKYFMFYWPVSTAVFCVSSIFFLLFSIIFCSWLTVADDSRPTGSIRNGHYESVIKPMSSTASSEVKDSKSNPNPDGEPSNRNGIRSSAAEGDSSSEPVTSLGVADLDARDMQPATPIPTVRQRKPDPAADNTSSG